MVIKRVKFLSHAKVIDLKERSSIGQFVWREKCCLNKNRLETVGIACIDLWPGFACWNCIYFQAELNHQVIWSHGVPDFGTSPGNDGPSWQGNIFQVPHDPITHTLDPVSFPMSFLRHYRARSSYPNKKNIPKFLKTIWNLCSSKTWQ